MTDATEINSQVISNTRASEQPLCINQNNLKENHFYEKRLHVSSSVSQVIPDSDALMNPNSAERQTNIPGNDGIETANCSSRVNTSLIYREKEVSTFTNSSRHSMENAQASFIFCICFSFL